MNDYPSDLLPASPAYDVTSHAARVRALHKQYVLNSTEACEASVEHILDTLLENLDYEPSQKVLKQVAIVVFKIFRNENIYCPTYEPIELHAALTQDERIFSNMELALSATNQIIGLLHSLLKNRASSSLGLDVEKPAIEITLIESIGDPHAAVQELHRLFEEFAFDRARTFPRLHHQLVANCLKASGFTWTDVAEEQKIKVDQPLHDEERTPGELVEAYLADTPFKDLLLMPLPFDIPLRTRFEHHWIVAPPGAGKSTALQYFIMRDLDLVAANQASIVVMESNRDLVKAIEGLKVFAPGERLAGKLVTIDAEDVEWPIALNLFDVGMDATRSYSAVDQEAFRNSVLSLYDYIFGALLSAEMTSRQHTLFHFTIELLLSIPSATLDTLIELMQPGGLQKYQDIVLMLDHDAQLFFKLKFNSKEFDRTKEQVVDRLFAVKRIRTLSRMFSAPKSKFDFFTEMGDAKVIVINVPQSLLQEEGVEIVGRFFISMILLAAHKRQLLPKEQRLPCFVYIDECQDFVRRDPKIPTILDQARKLNVGLILAHQRLQQLQPSVLDALYGATAIKFASKVSDAAAHALARDMRTTPEFILNQPPYHFAAYVRGLTETALSIRIPDTDMNKMPRMSSDEQAAVRQRVRDRYAISRDVAGSVPASPTLASTVTKTPATDESVGHRSSLESGDDWRS